MDGSGWQRKLHVSSVQSSSSTPLRADWTGDATIPNSVIWARINDRDLLADEEMACAMQHQAALLLRCILVLPF